MSYYLSSKDLQIERYLTRAQAREDRTVRKMNPEECTIVFEYREIEKAINLCATEMIFTKTFIYRMNINDLMYVANNFGRIISSLLKQKSLIKAIRAAFTYCKPDEDERKAIERVLKEIRERIDFLNKIPVPENIRLTPIQDYMDLLGADTFIREIKTVFPTSKDLYQAQKNGDIDEYVSGMMDTLKQAGKEEAYKERLAVYVNMIQKRKEKAEAEKEAERLAVSVSESKNGIDLFRELFFKGIRNIQTVEKIGLSKSAIAHHLIHGHRGKFCILCCGLGRNGQLIYRYMKKSGEASKSFQGCALYNDLPEAEEALKGFQKIYPDRAFTAVAI